MIHLYTAQKDWANGTVIVSYQFMSFRYVFVHTEGSLWVTVRGAHIRWYSTFLKWRRYYTKSVKVCGWQQKCRLTNVFCFLWFSVLYTVQYCFGSAQQYYTEDLSVIFIAVAQKRVPKGSRAMQESKPNLLGYWQACCANHLALYLQYTYIWETVCYQAWGRVTTR